ncbi:MAG TPA: biotin--[acetyl-CoA-carboxylase] ligase [Steroidobacteraceae bacterium]|nr:biotin--[acetyl-CoA-carboxylase] ligase [Steroidobacteraceae bacterium]
MSPTAPRLLGLLCDGSLHSGAQLAAALGVSRAAVWKLVGELRAAGVAIDSLSRRGYRLSAPVELLDAARMRAHACEQGRRLPDELEVHFLIDSTNDHLYAAPPPAPGAARVAFAELQSAGRGRRGRRWIAPFGSGLTFSISWTFAETPADLPALGLALGVAIAKVLSGLGAQRLSLKWPNDLLHDGRKLGGLLTQLRQESGGAATVVAGLGLNLALPDAARNAIEAVNSSDHPALAVADLAGATPQGVPSRNLIASRLVLGFEDALREFATVGFTGFAQEWAALDALRGAPVRVHQGSERFEGTARGTDRDGALLVESAGRVLRVFSGDVSVRSAAY